MEDKSKESNNKGIFIPLAIAVPCLIIGILVMIFCLCKSMSLLL